MLLSPYLHHVIPHVCPSNTVPPADEAGQPFNHSFDVRPLTVPAEGSTQPVSSIILAVMYLQVRPAGHLGCACHIASNQKLDTRGIPVCMCICGARL